MGNAAHVFDGLATERLVLRRFRPEDATGLFAYLSDASVYRWEPGKPVTMEEAGTLALERSRGSEFIAVTLKDAGTLVGHLYCAPVDPPRRLTWELGYIFSPRFQGRGYAAEAARALVAHVFMRWGAHRVMARCNPENTASWRLLERVGFRREGAFRSYGCIHEDGAGNPLWTDAYEYSLLAEDLAAPGPRRSLRAIILEYFGRLFGERDLSVLDEYLAPSYRDSDIPPDVADHVKDSRDYVPRLFARHPTINVRVGGSMEEGRVLAVLLEWYVTEDGREKTVRKGVASFLFDDNDRIVRRSTLVSLDMLDAQGIVP